MKRNIREAVHFFKSEPAYKRLFIQFRKKYESLGRIGGNVSAGLFSDDDLEAIASFFGMPREVLRAKKVISIGRFEQQLQETRFGEIALKELLDAYFGEVLISKKELQEHKEAVYQALIETLGAKYPKLDFWLALIGKKSVESRWMVRMAMEEPDRFAEMVEEIAKAWNHLPTTAERLPMFSQRMTANPHAFDLHTDLGKMFLNMLAVHRSYGESVISIPNTTESINELLQHYNIYRDDLLNFVTCSGFYAETEKGMHAVWREAVANQTVQNVPLRELVGLTRVYPASGKDVWIVENSGVCSTLLDYEPVTPIISTNGQFKLSALMLLDLLVADGCTLHYAGDFDPEGLGMAQRLLERYPDHVKLWRMGLIDYRKTVPAKELGMESLEKLKNIRAGELIEVAAEMKRLGKAGYQEALVALMLDDLRGDK